MQKSPKKGGTSPSKRENLNFDQTFDNVEDLDAFPAEIMAEKLVIEIINKGFDIIYDHEIQKRVPDYTCD